MDGKVGVVEDRRGGVGVIGIPPSLTRAWRSGQRRMMGMGKTLLIFEMNPTTGDVAMMRGSIG